MENIFKGVEMNVYGYEKSGKIIDRNSIMPTQEMQEIIDILWSKVRNNTHDHRLIDNTIRVDNVS